MPGMMVMIIDENQSWPDYTVAQPHAGLPLPVPGFLTTLQKKTELPQPDRGDFRTAQKYSTQKCSCTTVTVGMMTGRWI
ncbi:hypothetical protein D6G99_25255 [Salmonella enterica]|nr:hypothetical protein [Salmonella enterica]